MHNTLLTGPMYSSKSTRLINRIEKYVLAKKHIAWFEPVKDTRGCNHNPYTNKRAEELKKSPYVSTYRIESPEEIFKLDFVPAAIFIDEYFMLPFTRSFFYDYSNSKFGEVPLIFAGLINGWDCRMFPTAIEILPFMDEIDKELAICMECGKPANYFYYNGENWNKDATIDDNKGLYLCLCSDCYIKRTKEPLTAKQW